MQVTRAGCGPPHAPTRRPKRQEGNALDHSQTHARDPATRDGEDLRTRAPATTPRTPQGGAARAHQPTGSTRQLARRKWNGLHHALGRLGASSHQPRGSAFSWPPRARHSTNTTSWTLCARQGTTLRVPGTGTLMPRPTRPWLLRWRGLSERSTTQKRPYSGVMHVDVATMRTSSRRRPLRERRPWCWRGRAEPSPYQLRRLRRGLLPPLTSGAPAGCRLPGVTTRGRFMKGSVVRMASTPRVECSAELANAVVEATSALLQSEMKVLLHPEQLSVGAA